MIWSLSREKNWWRHLETKPGSSTFDSNSHEYCFSSWATSGSKIETSIAQHRFSSFAMSVAWLKHCVWTFRVQCINNNPRNLVDSSTAIRFAMFANRTSNAGAWISSTKARTSGPNPHLWTRFIVNIFPPWQGRDRWFSRGFHIGVQWTQPTPCVHPRGEFGRCLDPISSMY